MWSFCGVSIYPSKTNSPQNFVATIESEGVVAAQFQLAWVVVFNARGVAAHTQVEALCKRSQVCALGILFDSLTFEST